MNQPTERRSAEQQQAAGPRQPPASALIRQQWPGTFGWRHVKGVALVRLLVAVWLVILGSFFCASGHWWGAFLFAAAALVGWLAYLMPRWKRALDAVTERPAGS